MVRDQHVVTKALRFQGFRAWRFLIRLHQFGFAMFGGHVILGTPLLQLFEVPPSLNPQP